MSMIKCKECGKAISSLAVSCPQCGVPDPRKSLEEEMVEAEIKRIEEEIDGWRKEESRQAELYTEAHNRRFLWFGKKRVDHHVDLANRAQNKIIELQDKLYAVRKKWTDKKSL